jgi:hypothetical protein
MRVTGVEQGLGFLGRGKIVESWDDREDFRADLYLM